MNEDSCIQPRCPVRTTIELLGGKWKMLIIYQLSTETLRFGEIRKRLPDISEKILVQELKILADSHLIERINYGEVPPRVEYRLTAAGREVLPLIEVFKEFGLRYMTSQRDRGRKVDSVN